MVSAGHTRQGRERAVIAFIILTLRHRHNLVSLGGCYLNNEKILIVPARYTLQCSLATENSLQPLRINLKFPYLHNVQLARELRPGIDILVGSQSKGAYLIDELTCKRDRYRRFR
jgi:hypothetical protein